MWRVLCVYRTCHNMSQLSPPNMTSWLTTLLCVILNFCPRAGCGLTPLEAEVEALYGELETLESSVRSVRREIDWSQERTRALTNTTWSGFTARVAGGTDEFVAEGSVITFDEVEVNEGTCPCNLEGECFDSLFGFFICPETALYYFLVSLVSPSDHVNSVYLRMDTQPALRMTAAVNTSADLSSGSLQTGLITRCQQGTKVAVVADSGVSSENYVTLVPGSQSSFVGFRI